MEDFVSAGAAAAMPAGAVELTEELVVRGAFDFADANPALYKMLTQIGMALGDGNQTARSAVIVGAIEDQLQAAMDDGLIRQGDAHIMAQLQFAVVDGAYRAWLHSDDPARREDYINEAISCMKAMLAPESIK